MPEDPWPHLAPGQPPEIEDDPDSEAATRRIHPDGDHLTGFAELKAILRIRAFRRLWAVLGLSALGDWLGLLATATFAAEQVDNSLAKGAAFGSVIAVRLLPALVFGAIAGVFADRFDRRYTMVVCDLLRFAFFLTIPVASLLRSR